MDLGTSRNAGKPIFEALEQRLLLSASISGQKFEDLNANGVLDAGEPGLEGWRIYLDLDANGQWDAGEPFELTDAAGEYAFTGLASGTYVLAEEPQDGWCPSEPAWEEIKCLSPALDGVPAGSESYPHAYAPSTSADGRYVAFYSVASNLVVGDTNGQQDVFVYDRQTGLNRLVSVSSDGTQANGEFNCRPSVSADGRYVAFESTASNLVDDYANGQRRDIFVHDLQTGFTELVSLDDGGTGTRGDSTSSNPSISADGRYVAFESRASKLVPGDTNEMYDIFVYDRQTGRTERVSVDSAGAQGNSSSNDPSISADGRYVAFESDASNLAPDDTNYDTDIFVHDRLTGLTERVSVDSAGAQANSDSGFSSISGDGRYVAFSTGASNLVPDDTNNSGDMDLFVHDRHTRQTHCLSVNESGEHGWGDSYMSSISGDGRYVAFQSYAPNLVEGDTGQSCDIFIHELATGLNKRISVDSGGGQVICSGFGPSISADGRYVAFRSAASLAPGERYRHGDIFLVGATPATQLHGTHGVMLAPGETADDVNFGDYRPVSVSGQKFEDLNADGVKDAGESGLDGWTIELVDSASGDVVDTRVTADGGAYLFDDVAPGDYELREVLHDDWTQIHPDPPAYSMSLFSNDVLSGMDFANYRGATVSGMKFEDLDGDGFKDAGEDGMQGWVIELADPSTQQVIDTQTTSGGGLYSFAGIIAGDYEVRVVAQAGWMRTLPVEPAHVITLGYDEDRTELDFGSRAIPGEISGRMFDDLNANGIMDSGESSVPGMTVFVDIDHDGELDADEPNMLTLHDDPETPDVDETGTYQFTSLPAGAYKVVPILQPGWRSSNVSEDIYRVSVDSAGVEGNGDSRQRSISADGRYVAFTSSLNDLVAGDTGFRDIIVHDRQTGVTERVSVDSVGTQANGDSGTPSISADGRYVAFASGASNLVAGDTNGKTDIFVHDRLTGRTELLSVDSAGVQADYGALYPSISANGRLVAFQSASLNLVANDTNAHNDIFVRDRQTGLTERVSIDSAGMEGDSVSVSPCISADGRYVTFTSYASNLIADDTNYKADIFVHDRQTGLTERVSVDSAGVEANNESSNPSISADGRYVAFRSPASNLVTGDTGGYIDVFVHDLQTGLTERVSVSSSGGQANSYSRAPSISANGRYVAFSSVASNLVSDDTNSDYDVFVHDRQTGLNERVSVDSEGAQADNDSFDPCISAEGQYVAFYSRATMLVDDDTNGEYDIFVSPVNATMAINGRWVFLGTGQTATTVGIGAFLTASISGQKFEDLDYDGLKDAGEPGLDGWIIELVDPVTGEVIDTCTTSGGGDYLFAGLRPGDYEVREIVQEGWLQTSPDLNAYSLTLVSGAAVVDMDFGDMELASISGRKFEDIDGNGVFDVGEPSLNGTTIELVDPLSDDVLDTRTTASDGSYSFVDLLPGEYRVRDAVQDGWVRTLPADPGYHSISLGYAQELTGIDFGAQRLPGEITGQVFEDSNANNVRDPGEFGLDGWVIELLDADTGAIVYTTVTASIDLDESGDIDPETESGLYSFSGLASGGYDVVQFISPDWARDIADEHISRVSVSSAGVETDDRSYAPSISGDGRIVAFTSYASNLVPGDTNGQRDVFVRDRLTGSVERVSVDSSGLQGNSASSRSSISADGRYVAFRSNGSSLVAGDTNGKSDIFVHDRQTGITERVSVDSSGVQTNGYSNYPSISADGRYVAFESDASNLVSGDTNGIWDIFIHDRQTGLTRRASVDSAGAESNDYSRNASISGDGRYVAFQSAASNLVVGDTNDAYDAFVHDCQTGLTSRVSINSDGTERIYGGNYPSISADGRYVAFDADGSDNYAIWVHDRYTGLAECVSVGSSGAAPNGSSRYPSISADGRYVAFRSGASNLVADDNNSLSDVFVHDRRTGLIERVNVNSQGVEANDYVANASVPISADGRYVSFSSRATNLVVGDTNGASDIFVAPVTLGHYADSQSVFFNSGQTVSGVDFANWRGASVSGVQFEDINGDGVRGADEPGLDGWIIELVDYSNRDVIETCTTSGGGHYSLVGVRSGLYYLRHVVQDDWRQTFPHTNAYSLALSSGEVVVGMDFGAQRIPGEITGRVFEDVNRNGLEDADEPGLDGWVIELVDSSTGQVSQTQTTADGGIYSFADIVLGEYEVREAPQSDWVQTCPSAAAYSLSVVNSDVIADIDFGNARLGSISGLKFEDLNGDGVRDAGEGGLGGWTIELVDGDTGLTADVQVTSPDGSYSFGDLLLGDYELREKPRHGWLRTAPAARVHPIALSYDEDRAGVDFGARKLPGIHGREFSDYNANGVPDFGEPGLDGWTVELVDPDTGEVMETAITASIDLDGDGDIDPEFETGLYSFAVPEPVPTPGEYYSQTMGNDAFPGFYGSGPWLPTPATGSYSPTIRRCQHPGESAWWVFEGLPSAPYRVWIAWGHVDFFPVGTAVPYRVYTDGSIVDFAYVDGILAGEQIVDQTVPPADEFVDGVWWRNLGAYMAEGRLAVEIQGPQGVPDGELQFALADAVRIEEVPAEYHHTVRQVAQPGWSATSPADGLYDVVIEPGQCRLDVDFGSHDIVAPVVTVDALTTPDNTPTLSGTVDDPDAGVQISVDGNTYPGVNNGDGSWTLSGDVVDPPLATGVYDVTATAADLSGNAAADTTTAELTVYHSVQIVGRHVFYNNSPLDGRNGSASSEDDNAIDPAKSALAPGQIASPANYSNFAGGINGIMVDLAGMDAEYTPVPGDFGVRVYDEQLGVWASGPAPGVSLRSGAGLDGSDRVTLIWPDGAIVNAWIEITVKSDAGGGGLGLVDDDVFYFGNSVGDCDGDGAVGDSDLDLLIGEFGMRGDWLASDLDADGKVGLKDFAIMRSRFGESVSAPTFPAPAPIAAQLSAISSQLLAYGNANDNVDGGCNPAPGLGLVTSVNQSPLGAPSTNPAGEFAKLSVDEIALPQETNQPASGATVERELVGVLSGDDSSADLLDDPLVDLLAEAALAGPL